MNKKEKEVIDEAARESLRNHNFGVLPPEPKPGRLTRKQKAELRYAQQVRNRNNNPSTLNPE